MKLRWPDMLTLKEYQQKTLDALRVYCQLAVQYNDADTAYYQLTRNVFGTGVPYLPIPVNKKRAPGAPSFYCGLLANSSAIPVDCPFTTQASC